MTARRRPPSHQDGIVEGWPRSKRESVARWARPWIALSQRVVVPIGLIALCLAIYLARHEIGAILR